MNHDELWLAVQIFQWVCIAAAVVVLGGAMFITTTGINPRRRTK